MTLKWDAKKWRFSAIKSPYLRRLSPKVGKMGQSLLGLLTIISHTIDVYISPETSLAVGLK